MSEKSETSEYVVVDVREVRNERACCSGCQISQKRASMLQWMSEKSKTSEHVVVDVREVRNERACCSGCQRNQKRASML